MGLILDLDRDTGQMVCAPRATPTRCSTGTAQESANNKKSAQSLQSTINLCRKRARPQSRTSESSRARSRRKTRD
eukprot:scaffold10679_cov139-Isochrysis_galbana.AAC.2